MSNTDRRWERWGRVAPYYGVRADPRFDNGQIEQHRDAFFASGEATVAAFLARFEHQFGPLQRGRALDHGCGVGRLALPLARHFEKVVGLDVSAAMLAEAERNAAAAQADNLRFARADDWLTEADGSFDFVNSYMVLQHIPVRRGLHIAERLLDKVTPGGGFHLHVSVRTDRRRSRALWWASAHVPGVKIVQNVLAGRDWNAPAMQMNNYPLAPLFTALARRGITQLLVANEMHDRFLTLSLLGKTPGR